jgi:hypothetical protein
VSNKESVGNNDGDYIGKDKLIPEFCMKIMEASDSCKIQVILYKISRVFSVRNLSYFYT